MRQFDVFWNPSLEARKVAPFLVMLSSHHLRGIDEIIVAPVVNDATETVSGLEILVEIEGQRLTLVISEMFSLTPTGSRVAIDNLSYLEDDIRRAVDRLFTGF
ncbi:MAG: CcdB family protein [Caulobacter sp.]|nr:CcdB family protein [Caulobacter sp.]